MAKKSSRGSAWSQMLAGLVGAIIASAVSLFIWACPPPTGGPASPEEAELEAIENAKRLLDSVDLPVVILRRNANPEGEVEWANRFSERAFNQTRAQLEAMSVYRFAEVGSQFIELPNLSDEQNKALRDRAIDEYKTTWDNWLEKPVNPMFTQPIWADYSDAGLSGPAMVVAFPFRRSDGSTPERLLVIIFVDKNRSFGEWFREARQLAGSSLTLD